MCTSGHAGRASNGSMLGSRPSVSSRRDRSTAARRSASVPAPAICSRVATHAVWSLSPTRRTGAQMHARSGAFRLSSEKVDEAISAFEEEQLPRYKEQDGYKGFTLLADKDSGEVLGISFWESEDALKASDELGE